MPTSARCIASSENLFIGSHGRRSEALALHGGFLVQCELSLRLSRSLRCLPCCTAPELAELVIVEQMATWNSVCSWAVKYSASTCMCLLVLFNGQRGGPLKFMLLWKCVVSAGCQRDWLYVPSYWACASEHVFNKGQLNISLCLVTQCCP